MVGAVLTQNTTWVQAERAIRGLKAAQLLSVRALVSAPVEEVAVAIRSAGCFRIKAVRLQALARWLQAKGGEPALRRIETPHLRRELLAVHGIGPETADAILLYALERPVFVIDAYSRRLFARLGVIAGTESYEQLQERFHQALPPDRELYHAYHALIVTHGKTVCRARPRCADCHLAPLCAYAGTFPAEGGAKPGR